MMPVEHERLSHAPHATYEVDIEENLKFKATKHELSL
jgi:hypothetical protein